MRAAPQRSRHAALRAVTSKYPAAHRGGDPRRAATVIALLVALALAAPASALTVGGPYSWWTFPSSGFYNLDQQLTVIGHDPGIHRFWAHQFAFDNSTGGGGYIGLQVGSAQNGTKIALFSIFGANGHSGASCLSGSEVMNGVPVPFHSCHIDPYDWTVGHTYRLRVWATNADASGQWYGAWVKDMSTGVENQIGSLRVPLGWGGLQEQVSWTERFNAAPSTCSGIGWSRVQWGFPTANDGTIKIMARDQVVSAGDCPSYTRVLHFAGADVQETGRSSNETSWCGNLFPTSFGPIARCTKTDPSRVYYGNFSPLTGGFTHIIGPLAVSDPNEHAGSYASSEGSGTFQFFGGPTVSTAFGPTSYGEQRWQNPVYGPLIRLGNVNFLTGRFYPDGGWLQNLGP